MSDTSFLKPDAVTPAVETKQDEVSLEEKFKIVSKRVDDSQNYIKEQAKVIEVQAEMLKKYQGLEDRINELKLGEKGTQAEKDTIPSFDPEELLKKTDELVSKRLQEKDQQTAVQKNWDMVSTELTERYGAEVDSVVAQVAKDNDITVEEAIALAKNKPRIFLNMFPKTEKASPIRTTQGSVNTSAVRSTKQTVKLPEINHHSVKSMLEYYEAAKKQLAGS